MDSRPTRGQGTVIIVDDDEDMRNSVVWLLETVGLPVRAFASAAEYRAANVAAEPGCLVLEVRMAGESGLELYESLIQEGHHRPAIFITAHADVPTAVRAMKTGAVEFLEKPFDRKTLLESVFNALRLDQEWRLRARELEEMDGLIGRLSAREMETLELIIAGESNKVMASRLGITERAVEMRRANIMKKLGVRSLAELLERVITRRVLAEVRRAAGHQPFPPG